ncbi:MAG: hypothetical protein HYW05_04865 [Candidatus Diapherotrites archaeon]|nr:hypothetical protein [Candidatus Diapherotrites archaeon]
MAISSALLGAYTKIEDGFYSVLDFLDGKGIPVYAYADFLDNKGIPAFPFTVAVIGIIIALVAGFALFGGAWNVNLRLSITDNENSGLYGVSVSIFNEDGAQLNLPSKTFGNNDVVALSGVKPGDELTIRGAKTGYKASQSIVQIKDREMAASLVLEKIIEPIIGMLRFIDEETGDVIRNAKVTARWDAKEIVSETDNNGVVRLLNIPKGESITLQVESDAYESDEITKSFDSNNLYEVALVPKAAGLLGKSTLLINVYDASTNLLMQNARIQVYDKSDSGLITDVVDKDGQATLAIEKGTSIRIAVSRENYVKYDSSESNEDRTLRSDEETWNVYMQKGGSILQVNVSSRVDSQPIMNAEVMLFNSNLEMIDYNKTGFGGSVEFRDLNADFTYFVTAYNSNYLPARMRIVPIQVGKSITLALERITTLNSASLGIFVSDSKGNAANDAVLNFYEFAESEKQPLGIPQMRTDVTGYAAATLAIGANVFVNAVKGAESADGNIAIQAATFNKLYITLSHPANLVVINLLDEFGNPLKSGTVRVEDAAGNLLFDGNITNGYIIVDTQGNKFLKVRITTSDGKEYEEEVSVEGKDEITIQIGGETSDTLAPQIKLLGVYDASEKEVKGISKGQDYYLKFETVWPAGKYTAGVHVRVGNDAISNVDQDDVGILGFNVIGARYFYGRTYSPFPEPGNEGIDLQNSGTPGQYSKWLELYFDSNPNGTRIIKVRIKAKETITADKIDVHYRAWAIIANRYYRAPEDALLADAQYTSERTGLYAGTNDAEISVFETIPTCENELCASYRFIDAMGNEFSPENFKAVKGNAYALEIALKPDKDVSATIKLSTSRTLPKIAFTGYEVMRFTEIADNNKSDTELQIDDVQAIANEETKIWAYFRANSAENSYITSQIISGESVLSENFYFNIYVEKEMYIETSPKDVLFGQDFRIVVKDIDGNPVEKAQLQLKKSTGELLQTIVGDATTDKGAGGQYLVKNGFDAGILLVEASAENYKSYATQIAIGKEGLLSIAESIEVDIPKGTESAEAFADLSNASPELIDAIDYEIVKSPGFPEEMEITVAVPSSLPSGARQNVTVIAEYSGKKEREHAEADLIIRGTVAGSYVTSTKTRIIATYNRELEQGCLEFSVSSLKFYLLDDKGSSESATLTVKNTCNVPLALDPEIRAKGTADKDIIISADSITLGAAGTAEETATIRIDASNELDRKFFNRRSFSYEIVYKSDALTKTLPVEVVIWNKYFALTAPSNIEMWLAQTRNDQFAISEVPLFIRNGSEFEISHITFSMEPAFLQNVNVEFLPKYPVETLQKGRTLTPPAFIVAKSDSSKGQVVQGTIVVNGTINGQEYELRRILLTIHVSAPICLKITPETNPLEFSSTKVDGQIIEQKITAYNTCNEEIRIAALEPKDAFSTNPLVMIPSDVTLQPMQKAEMRLALTKNQAQSGTLSAFLAAFMIRSFKWTNSERFTIKVELGKGAESSGPSTGEVEVKYCDKEGYAKIKFPKIAKTDNCDTAYCDAEQFASFLIKRIESKMNDAKLKVLNFGSEVFNTNCERFANYCMFSQLGVQTESFTAYLQLDNLSPDMLKSVISEKSGMLGPYYVQYVANAQEFETNVARSGWGNHLAIAGAIKGCGRYKVKINGAVPIQGSAIATEQMNVLIEVSQREATAECDNYIYNAMNFLPVDASRGVSDPKESWLATVANSNDKLNAIATDFAKTLFNKEERVVNSSASNHVQLAVGGVEGAVVQLSLQSSGDASKEGRGSADSQKTLYANINEALNVQSGQQKEIAAEAGKAIRELKNAAISKDSCITANLLSLKLRSTKEIGEFKIESCKEGILKMHTGGASCCEYSVVSDISEKVKTESRTLEPNLRGISKLWIESAEEKREIGKDEALSLKWFEKEKKWEHPYKLCVKPDNFIADAHNKEVAISAQSKDDPARTAEEANVKLQMCGIHPVRLMSKLAKGEVKPGSYYANAVWGGGPEKINMGKIKLVPDAYTRLDNAKQQLANTQQPGQTAYETKRFWLQESGIGVYFAACGIAAMIAGSLKMPGIGGVADVIWNCGVPAGWASFKNGRETFKILGYVPKPGGMQGDAASALASQNTEVVKRYYGDITNAAAVELIGRYGGRLTIPGLKGLPSESSFKAAAKQVAEQIAQQENEKFFGGAATNYVTERAKALEETMTKNAKRYLGEKTLDDSLTKAVADAVEKTADNVKVITEFDKYKTNFGIDAEDVLKKTWEKSAEEIFKTQEILDHASRATVLQESTIGDITPAMQKAHYVTQVSGQIDNISEDLTKSVVAKLEEFSKTTVPSTVRDNIKNDIKTSLTKNVERLVVLEPVPVPRATGVTLVAKFKPPKDFIDETIKGALNSVKPKKPAAALTDDLTKNVIAKNVLKEFGKDADLFVKSGGAYQIPMKRFSRFFTSMVSKENLINVGKGLLTGIIEDAIGMLFYSVYMHNVFPQLQPTLNVVGVSAYGPTFGQISDIDFVKYSTYRIDVEEKDGKTQWKISGPIVDVEGELKNVKDVKWIEECDPKELSEPVPEYGLLPDASKFDRQDVKYIIAYYENYGGLIGSLAHREVGPGTRRDVPDALLVAVGILKSGLGIASSDHIMGCDVANPDSKEPAQNIECAARWFHEKGITSNSGKQQIINALKDYNNDPKNKHTPDLADREYEAVYNMYLQWNQFKVIPQGDSTFILAGQNA